MGEAQKITYSIPMSLPLSRNHNFTGRTKELLEIHKILKGPEVEASDQRIMVLYGLGGIGKSQLAMQYAYQYENTYTSVWWVNATSMASLSRDYRMIAQELVSYHAQVRARSGQTPDYSWLATLLSLPVDAIDQAGQLATLADIKLIIQAVRLWLADTDNQGWLIIFDNHDDLEMVNIRDFLPPRSGSVIITSRAKGSQRLGSSSFEVDVVQLEDGIEILRKSAGTKIEEFDNGRFLTLPWICMNSVYQQ